MRFFLFATIHQQHFLVLLSYSVLQVRWSNSSRVLNVFENELCIYIICNHLGQWLRDDTKVVSGTVAANCNVISVAKWPLATAPFQSLRKVHVVDPNVRRLLLVASKITIMDLSLVQSKRFDETLLYAAQRGNDKRKVGPLANSCGKGHSHM